MSNSSCNVTYFDFDPIDEITQSHDFDTRPTAPISSPLFERLVNLYKIENIGSLEERIIKKMESETFLTYKERQETAVKESEFIADIKRENEEFTESDIQLLLKNNQKQQEAFNKLTQRDRRHRVKIVKVIHPYLTNEEIIYGLDQVEDEQEAVVRFASVSFLCGIRQHIAEDNMPKKLTLDKTEKNEDHIDEDDEDIDPDVEFGERNRARKKKTIKLPGKKVTDYKRTKLRLDDALEKMDNFEGWSPARIKAFKSIDKNPNAYYYRFNAPGETQSNGAWTNSEKKLFLERLQVLPVSGQPQWGIFSMAIPCRVGYQCANFYRLLVKRGEIIDPDYALDEKGNIYCKFGKGSRRRKKDDDSSTIKKKKKKDDGDVVYNSDAQDDEIIEKNVDERIDTRKGDQSPVFIHSKTSVRLANPLLGFKDPMTLEQVEKPCISPYGHVMGHATWQRILQTEEVCPFTKQPLQMRDLIRLTFDNIEKYQDQIKNG